ncbi:MAG: NfeD family protein [Deltaproteobacteria bacterium]|nr:NfeD family protein [Deltaproteobacteria bacterium]
MKRNGSARVLMKYLLLQIPMLLLVIVGLFLAQRYLGLPTWVAWGGSVVWLAKDMLLFPLVRRSYDDRNPNNVHSLSGGQGRAIEMLDNSGYVRVRGALWWAEVAGARRPIQKGERVRVQGCRGLVLLVQPDDLEDTSGGGEQKVAAERFGLPLGRIVSLKKEEASSSD